MLFFLHLLSIPQETQLTQLFLNGHIRTLPWPWPEIAHPCACALWHAINREVSWDHPKSVQKAPACPRTLHPSQSSHHRRPFCQCGYQVFACPLASVCCVQMSFLCELHRPRRWYWSQSLRCPRRKLTVSSFLRLVSFLPQQGRLDRRQAPCFPLFPPPGLGPLSLL